VSGDIQNRLNAFTRSILEWRDGVVEWPESADTGEALLPKAVAAALGCPEMISLSYEPNTGDLAANLSTDFIERIGAVFEGQSAIGACQIPELYLKQSALDAPIARAFTWHNARVTMRSTNATRIEYHTWYFRASLQSEDQWEDVMSVSLNAESHVEVCLSALETVETVEPNIEPATNPADTYPAAARRAQRRLETCATDFMARLESRLARDRRRLKEYYHALARQAKTKAAKSKTEEGAQKQAEISGAVELELRRKLLELVERYGVRGELAPLALIRLELPVLAVECEVLRRRSRRIHTVYWNPLLKALEPLCCHRCGEGTFSVAFTDDEVAATCPHCAE